MPFNSESYGKITWNDCSLRKYLNESFITKAFSDNEKAQIIETNSDKVFILTVEQTKRYLSNDTKKDVSNTSWWLQTTRLTSRISPIDGKEKIITYAALGEKHIINEQGYPVNISKGVRPAMWIKVE